MLEFQVDKLAIDWRNISFRLYLVKMVSYIIYHYKSFPQKSQSCMLSFIIYSIGLGKFEFQVDKLSLKFNLEIAMIATQSVWNVQA